MWYAVGGWYAFASKNEFRPEWLSFFHAVEQKCKQKKKNAVSFVFRRKLHKQLIKRRRTSQKIVLHFLIKQRLLRGLWNALWTGSRRWKVRHKVNNIPLSQDYRHVNRVCDSLHHRVGSLTSRILWGHLLSQKDFCHEYSTSKWRRNYTALQCPSFLQVLTTCSWHFMTFSLIFFLNSSLFFCFLMCTRIFTFTMEGCSLHCL